MTNTPLDPTVPSPDPNNNHDPAGPRDGETVPLVDGAMVIPDKRGNGDDDGDDENGGDDEERCAEHLEELAQRLGDLETEAYCAAKLLEQIPRNPSPSAEVPMRRLWRMVERVAHDMGAVLQYAEAAVAKVRGSHRKRGGNDDGSNGNGGAVQP